MLMNGIDSDVAGMYLDLLGRPGQQFEIDFWVQQYNNGMSEDAIRNSFLNSPERQTYLQKQQAAAAVPAQVQTQVVSQTAVTSLPAPASSVSVYTPQQLSTPPAVVQTSTDQGILSSLTSSLQSIAQRLQGPTTPTAASVAAQQVSAKDSQNKMLMYGALGIGALLLLKKKRT